MPATEFAVSTAHPPGIETALHEFGLSEFWLGDINIDSPAAEIVAKGVEFGTREDSWMASYAAPPYLQ